MIVLRKISTVAGVSTDIVLSGALIGVVNGINKIFYTEYNYKSGKITINYNGQELTSPDDFEETDTNEITFIYITPNDTDILYATYQREA